MTFKKVQFMETLAVLSTSIRALNLTIDRQEMEELSPISMGKASRMEGSNFLTTCYGG